jgi:hypothetical protein
MEPTEPLTEDRRDPSGDPVPGSRRQGALAAAGALVVAAFLVAITLPTGSDSPGRDAGPDRPSVSPTPPRPTDYIRRSSVELVANPRTRLLDIGITEDGTIAAVWESRDREDQALAIDRPDGTAYVADPGQLLVSVVTAPGGLLVHRADYYKVGVLRTSGAMDPVTLTDVPVEPQPGDVAVDLGSGPRIFRADDATVYALPAGHAVGARAGFVTPDGTLVVSKVPGVLAGNGDTAVEAHTGSSAAGVRVTYDAGATWRAVPARAIMSGPVASAAVAVDGTVLLADVTGTVTEIPRDGSPSVLADAPRLAQLQAVGDRVWGVARHGGRGPLFWTDDSGATWHPMAVPGLH